MWQGGASWGDAAGEGVNACRIYQSTRAAHSPLPCFDSAARAQLPLSPCSGFRCHLHSNPAAQHSCAARHQARLHLLLAVSNMSTFEKAAGSCSLKAMNEAFPAQVAHLTLIVLLSSRSFLSALAPFSPFMHALHCTAGPSHPTPSPLAGRTSLQSSSK